MKTLTIEVTYKNKVDGYVHKVRFYNEESMGKYVDEILKIKKI